ncbi:Hypothetical predicted protein [Podarcis lilfordi]|uniref:Uncharacterized protein n=1 Tax=Podarcis lilfordi TaxID=74358 RepID=A0AA35KFL1_9SAUR|nr:Hypothetical predicted protein [Podarcis lilfordi]
MPPCCARGMADHMFRNSQRPSFSQAQRQPPPADSAGGTQEDGYVSYIAAVLSQSKLQRLPLRKATQQSAFLHPDPGRNYLEGNLIHFNVT